MVRNLVRTLSTLLLVATLAVASGFGNADVGMDPEGFAGGDAGAEMDPNG